MTDEPADDLIAKLEQAGPETQRRAAEWALSGWAAGERDQEADAAEEDEPPAADAEQQPEPAQEQPAQEQPDEPGEEEPLGRSAAFAERVAAERATELEPAPPPAPDPGPSGDEVLRGRVLAKRNRRRWRASKWG